MCVCVCWENGRKKIINFKRSHYSVKERKKLNKLISTLSFRNLSSFIYLMFG